MPHQFISDKIAVIGIGLIGASFALAIKHKKLPFSVSLYDKNSEAREEARALSIGDRIEDELSEAVAGAGLVVMAVPVGAMAEVMAAAAPNLAKGCVVTDTGSTKRSVIRDTKDLIPEGCHFIPGHPLAGTEFSGPAAGFPSLFEGRYWLVLPNGSLQMYLLLAGATLPCADLYLFVSTLQNVLLSVCSRLSCRSL